jgi:sRNA-binding protein
VTNKIAAAMGWSNRYAWQVVAPWKAWKVYCRAVLCTATRITLEGAPAELVDDKARELAREQLAKLAARKLARERLEKLAARAPTPSPCEKSPTAKPVTSHAPQPGSAKPSERLGIAGLKAAAQQRRAAAAGR